MWRVAARDPWSSIQYIQKLPLFEKYHEFPNYLIFLCQANVDFQNKFTKFWLTRKRRTWNFCSIKSLNQGEILYKFAKNFPLQYISGPKVCWRPNWSQQRSFCFEKFEMPNHQTNKRNQLTNPVFLIYPIGRESINMRCPWAMIDWNKISWIIKL